MAELSAAKSPSTPSAAGSEPRRAVAIWDGHGGMLTLDLACGDLYLLVDAWRTLLGGATPPWASLIKVYAGNEVYVLSNRQRDSAVHLSIAKLYDPSEHVILDRDLAHMTVALIEQLLVFARHPAPAPDQDSTQRVDG